MARSLQHPGRIARNQDPKRIMPSTTDQTALVTCSYGPDLRRCERLCQSVDRWVSDDIPHLLIVPARDLPRFRPLQNTRRSILAVEEVVPGRFWQTPFSQRWWLDSAAWPVRGWIMQQVTKLSANFATGADNIVFADSDIQFIRPFSSANIVRDGALRLYRLPGAMSGGEHLKWHHRAADLLGEERRYFGADYIGQLITWRRSHLQGLQAHMENISGKPWYRGVARSLRVSEYILYGAYIDAVVDPDERQHYGDSHDLCHCCWFRDEVDALATGRTPLNTEAVAVLLQSNLGLSDSEENRILRRIVPAAPTILETVSA